MSKALLNLDQVKELLKPYLQQYLIMQGVRYTPGRNFVCINRDHDDWDGDGGSCGIVRGNQNVFHCFGCSCKGDIFLAAHYLENKPLHGKGFVVENMKHLANLFGVDMPEMKLSPEDLHEMSVRNAYAHASAILTTSTYSPLMEAKLAAMGWKEETRLKMGIGSVTSFDDYISRMMKFYELKFLQDVDLANPKIFRQNNLIFTVSDEHGSPLGFAARRLDYEDEIIQLNANVAGIEADSTLTAEQKKERKDQLEKPRKYHNTSEKNPFYQKIRRLFGFHLAKKFAPPLFIMEGYPDAATAQDHGMKNACAIGSTGFSKEHIDVILELGIKHIVIVLDGDVAGYVGTDRAVKLIEEAVGDRVGLKVELIQMPKDSDDPDRFIRLYGIEEFQALPRLDIFSWKIKRDIEAGLDPVTLANEAVPLIVNEPNHLLRLKLIEKLAAVTKVSEEAIRTEVTRRSDEKAIQMREERTLIVARMMSELKRNPDAVSEILRQGLTSIETVENRVEGYDPRNVLASYDYLFDSQMNHTNALELRTGWTIYDRVMDGIPRSAAFLSVPGKPNQGKSSLLSNLCWRLPEFNEDILVLYHTVDDPLNAAMPRILGSKTGMPSKLFKKAGYYLSNPEGREFIAQNYPHFPEIYHREKQWIQDMGREERLIVSDINLLAGSMPSLENWLKGMRKRFPSRPIVCMGDNFSLYHLEVASDSEAVRAREKSKSVKRIANLYQISMIMTCEITKESLKPGIRPRMSTIKDTGGVAYDASANLGAYNDLKDRGDAADLVWQDVNHMEPRYVDGLMVMAPKRKPVLEMVVDKNKLTEYDGSIFFEFEPVSGRLNEATESDQARYRDLAAAVTTRSMAAQIGGSAAPNRAPF